MKRGKNYQTVAVMRERTSSYTVTDAVRLVKQMKRAKFEGRDLVIVLGALGYQLLVRPVSGEPSRISKLNTALQMLFVLFVLSRAGFGWPDAITITVLGAAILVTTVISGVDYVLSWTRRARAGE